MIFLNLLRTTQLQVKCILSKDVPTHEKYDPNNLFMTKPQEYIECPRIYYIHDLHIKIIQL